MTRSIFIAVPLLLAIHSACADDNGLTLSMAGQVVSKISFKSATNSFVADGAPFAYAGTQDISHIDICVEDPTPDDANKPSKNKSGEGESGTMGFTCPAGTVFVKSCFPDASGLENIGDSVTQFIECGRICECKKSCSDDGTCLGSITATNNPTTPEEDVATPEEPATPEEDAATPEEPATPEEDAATPEEPVTPEEDAATPEEPATPEEDAATPEEPATPEEDAATPEEPATPEEDAGTPEEPVTPEEDAATPEEPATPDEDAATPEEPATPAEDAATPEEPATPEEDAATPEEPATPVEDAATPDEPATPEEDAATPEEPATPEEDAATPEEQSIRVDPVTPEEDPATVEETTTAANQPDDVLTTSAPPGAAGDPHFKTHGGEMYDFHGGCDLVLLDNPAFSNGQGMRVHIRTKIETWWSYVQAVAIQIGDETVEITGGQNNNQWIFTNGVPNKPMEDGNFFVTKFAGLTFRTMQKGGNKEAHIYLGNGEKLLIKTYYDFVKVAIKGEESIHYTGSLGLLGTFPEGKRVSRDGVTIIEDVNKFGQEWQVKPDEPKLFHSYDDAWVVPSDQKCAMPSESVAKTNLRRRRLVNGIDASKAEKACSHLQSSVDRKACIFDVLATQDVGMAAVW